MDRLPYRAKPLRMLFRQRQQLSVLRLIGVWLPHLQLRAAPFGVNCCACVPVVPVLLHRQRQ